MSAGAVCECGCYREHHRNNKSLDLKSLPEEFDNTGGVIRWYINQLALGFGVDIDGECQGPGPKWKCPTVCVRYIPRPDGPLVEALQRHGHISDEPTPTS